MIETFFIDSMDTPQTVQIAYTDRAAFARMENGNGTFLSRQLNRSILPMDSVDLHNKNTEPSNELFGNRIEVPTNSTKPVPYTEYDVPCLRFREIIVQSHYTSSVPVGS